MNNLLSYCGLIDGKIRASDKDLPVVLNFCQANINNSALQVGLNTVLIQIKNFISGACKCTAKVFSGRKRGVCIPSPLSQTYGASQGFFHHLLSDVSAISTEIRGENRSKVTKMLGLYSVKK